LINPAVLLTDLKRLLGQLEGDLRERADDVTALGESLRAAYDRAKQAERTAQPFETWREEYLTQVAAAWILGCVFVRFIEDNALIDPPLLAGSGPRLAQAKDQRTLYFQKHPTDSDRDYLYFAFRKVEALPVAAPLFDGRHNPLWAFGVSGDGATLLVEFWQRIDPATGMLAHDFTDPALNTRFLGDLYQDLSEAAQRKYALLQTPEFVEEFILDRTLTPAIAEFGLPEVRLIDPACGSGHFLLGAFHRLLHEWQKRDPAVNVRELAQRALSVVHGVDLNPYAIAIARFRLVIAALRASDVHRLADAPAFQMNLATGDSLLHGPRPGGERQIYLDGEADPLRHVYDTEDAEELRRILGKRYHIVVGNPPYITVKDGALNEAYRLRFGSCYRQYSLAVPFMERFFDLAIAPIDADSGPAGFVGMITANSFMKREFGKRLIEEYIPRWDLTHVIDTSGAYIPGHGTPTVILFGRHRRPVSAIVRAGLGIRGEPTTPNDPSRGLVWSAIVNQIDQPGSQSPFMTVADVKRDSFHSHPWVLGGAGASDLKAFLDSRGRPLAQQIDHIGYTGQTNADEAMIGEASRFLRAGCEKQLLREFVVGDSVRDFNVTTLTWAYVPYDGATLISLERFPGWLRCLWPFRTTLWNRATFSKRTYREEARPWWEWHLIRLHRLNDPECLVFANVATHNHFALNTVGRVFNSHAPVVKLGAEASRHEYLALLGLLNSSTACFWFKQVCQTKGSSGMGRGIYDERWESFYEIAAAAVAQFPVRESLPNALTRDLEAVSSQRAALSSSTVLRKSVNLEHVGLALSAGRDESEIALTKLIALQEECDWECYRLYGLVDDCVCPVAGKVPALKLGERAFEIVMARRMLSGDLETAWFERHGSTPITDLPIDWPVEYREIVEKRIALIESNPRIGLIEQPEYKRRWNIETWEEQQERACRQWLLTRLEGTEVWQSAALASVSNLSDRMRRDATFMKVAELYRGRSDFDVTGLVAELVESDAVPFLSVLRYRPTGLRKRMAWEKTWDLQRREDEKEEVGEIPVPPKYRSEDFLDSKFWNLRGALDVPKERFISYPHAEREADPTLVIGWAGWDHLRRAKALAAYYVRMKEQEGWPPARLAPLLAGLLELLPWLKQWHNELDPAYGIGMGDYFAGFVDEEARALGFTLDDVRAWQPPAENSRRRRKTSI
jgi:hypothetical protein